MEGFKKKIKSRINTGAVMLLFGVALIAGSLILGERANVGLDVPDFLLGAIHGFNIGVICGLMAVAVFYMIRCAAALRDDDKLKKLYIKETDERTLMIYQKAGSIGMNFSTIGLLVGAFVSAYFNFAVFVTLLGACLFLSLVRVFLKLYYHAKL